MKCDLHTHTSYSFDGISKPEEMVETALSKGLDCFLVSDHGKVEGAKKAIEYAKGKNILVIPGIEIKTTKGDVIGFNIKEPIPNHLTPEETIKRIKEKGGMVILPHPFAWFEGFKGSAEKIKEMIDALEIFNASILGPGNKLAKEFAKKYNLPFTAGSDAHSKKFIGKAYLEIPGDNLTIEEIIRAIREKRGRVIAEKTSALEKIFAHLRRNKAKIKNYVRRKEKPI